MGYFFSESRELFTVELELFYLGTFTIQFYIAAVDVAHVAVVVPKILHKTIENENIAALVRTTQSFCYMLEIMGDLRKQQRNIPLLDFNVHLMKMGTKLFIMISTRARVSYIFIHSPVYGAGKTPTIKGCFQLILNKKCWCVCCFFLA